jgi:Putative Ig domain
MQITGDNVPPGMVGDSYQTTFHAEDATAPVSWSITGDIPLPAGLTLDSEHGTISGTPAPEAQGTTSVTITAADAHGSANRPISLLINPALKISASSPPPSDVQDGIARLQATGGAPPYTWELASGSWLPDDLRLDATGDIVGVPQSPGTTRFRAKATDNARPTRHTDTADFRIKVSRVGSELSPTVARVSVSVRPPSWLRQRLEALHHISNVMFSLLGIVVPSLGTVWIIIYAFGTPGHHWIYLGTAMLASLAAFLSGCLAGFLFGIPRIVSSGQLRQQKGASAPAYTPSSNLAEVSDWLTKLLLGAGLVQLTRLGRPIGSLIDHVAAGLYLHPADRGAAVVTAGAILLALAFAGLLDGYVGTTMWYQKHIANL